MPKDLLTQAKPILILLGVCAVLVGGIAWLMNGGPTAVELTDSSESIPAPLTAEKLAAYDVDITNNMNPIVVLNTTMGTIELELFEDKMPITAGNFKKLVNEGYYDGIKFHRVMDGFMIQGGDPITKTDQVMSYGTGGPGYSIPDEFVKNDLLSNVRGTIAMANSGPNTGGSQFFVNLVDNTYLDFDKAPLDSKHPVFGRVVAGMDVVDAIGQVETNGMTNLPLEDIVIESATIKN